MASIAIKNGTIINEGKRIEGDLYIRNGRIEQVGGTVNQPADKEIDATGCWVMPGAIDDQVHFREPGLTHKAEIYTEARAAVAGGVTSFMEMPNTKPPAITQELLQAKYDRAAQCSLANYSFYMGTSNDNLEEVLKTDPRTVCGTKIFMGSSTGNMLVDDEHTLAQLFAKCPTLITTHCEDEATIRANLAKAKEKYGDDIPMDQHPVIRNVEACYKSSSLAVELAKKHGTRLHVFHISTARELELFESGKPIRDKRITAEVCAHHLWFTDQDYARLGSQIKCNPAIKTLSDRDALRQGLKRGTLDVLATDHAPHTWEEKQNPYTSAPSGLPLVQHPIVMMLEMAAQGLWTVEEVAKYMSHAVAECFRIQERGYLREGYWGDVVVVKQNDPWTVAKDNLLYKCVWSPLEGHTFQNRVTHTLVNGHLAYTWDGGKRAHRFDEGECGYRILFNPKLLP